jgi:hypothetical protein
MPHAAYVDEAGTARKILLAARNRAFSVVSPLEALISN